MNKEIEKNIDICNEILERFARLSDSEGNERNTWLKIGVLETQTTELKELYWQIID